ncbi:hypothetical protein [Novosphingobium pentaromativorans]|uniref:Uncharacterized protein n=1 Tax=Novosphingobium pentaromativorans US6-1 TaxID=1088721 RepID=G6EIY7_9SPHN|nr:hypothetical protein [Novosphingobium pentaromativorans]AIT78947.1 hypothetical protein JI59_03500 [Novosphingobium pentaromativorans US6-1]EHJ58746.1 hypothetical protein NSU_4308 [Novosphingobium pentaromativorans US6-1]
MARKFLISRVALAMALAGGMAVAAAPTTVAAKEKKAAKASFSKEYAAVAAEIDKTVTEAQNDPAVKAASDKARAAKTDAEMAAARAEVDAAMGGILAKLKAADAAATEPLDKLKQGELTRNVGIFMSDVGMQHRGLVMMAESGAMSPESAGQVQYLAGVTAYQGQQYAEAARWLQAAYDGGYRDPQGMLQAVLADSYKRSNNPQAALAIVHKELEAAKASGAKPNETSIRTALQAAYDAKQLAPSADYAAMLGQYYPQPDSWNAAISVVRQLASLPGKENLDLMRLMYVTGAMKDKRDYLEYIENVDPRAYPGEALKIMNDGISKGKLSTADLAGEKANTESRVSADKASLAAQERDAMKPGATGATLAGTGDVFLSYDQPAKAETFYTMAMGKPGVDANAVAMHLGMAQALQGKYAEAQANFAKVSGSRAPVAKLWTAYAASKTTPAAAPAAAAAPQS